MSDDSPHCHNVIKVINTENKLGLDNTTSAHRRLSSASMLYFHKVIFVYFGCFPHFNSLNGSVNYPSLAHEPTVFLETDRQTDREREKERERERERDRETDRQTEREK